jgi:hypothetical protein
MALAKSEGKNIKSIIDIYIEKLLKLKKEANSIATYEKHPLIINEDWKNIEEDIQIIYCGDNPGVKEKATGKYFKGNAGDELTMFIDINNKYLGVSKYCFFNKTPFHSIKTIDITQSIDKKEYVKKSIKITLRCLYELWVLKQIPIYILGINEKSYIVKIFKECLLSCKDESFKKSLVILNHPSHNSLASSFGKQTLMLLDENNFNYNLTYKELIEKAKQNWL